VKTSAKCIDTAVVGWRLPACSCVSLHHLRSADAPVHAVMPQW